MFTGYHKSSDNLSVAVISNLRNCTHHQWSTGSSRNHKFISMKKNLLSFQKNWPWSSAMCKYQCFLSVCFFQKSCDVSTNLCMPISFFFSVFSTTLLRKVLNPSLSHFVSIFTFFSFPLWNRLSTFASCGSFSRWIWKWIELEIIISRVHETEKWLVCQCGWHIISKSVS